MFRMIRTLLVAAALAATLIASPAQAQAGEGTILYIQGGDVWLSTPDGTQRHQVTADGGWTSPSMADDGTIVAVKDKYTLVQMDAQGTVLTAFDPPTFGQSGLSSAQVSGDGQYVTYWSVEICEVGDQIRGCYAQSIVYADGRQQVEVGGATLTSNGTWLPGNQVALGQYGVDTLAPGEDVETDWFRFDATDGDAEDGPDSITSISADDAGELLGVVGQIYLHGPADDGSQDQLVEGLFLYDLDGPPPARPTRIDCVITEEEGETLDLLAMAPAGDGFVVESSTDGHNAGEETTQLLIARDADLRSCDLQLAVLADGAIDPFWSAAPYAPTGSPQPGPDPEPTPGPDPSPAPDPNPSPGGGSTPPQPDEALIELPDGARLDGGGAADPVGQTVATSEAIWADGGASFVVLATADRFPDALAGAALAGEHGPILVTPFDDQLDPRVEAEIARVTGGQGFVVVLGGTSAVTEEAAAQARAAAGADTCAAPFPGDCRYAGGGREHTAALIGETVLALNGGSGGRVVLARGDAFADAITGGAYAAEAGVPILLTPPTSLNAATEQFIVDNGIGEAIILGGTAAIDQATMDAVPTRTRRIAGDERTATAAAIATQLWEPEGLGGGGVVLVNVRDQDGWHSALSAAVVSALANAPQLGVETPPVAVSDVTLQAAAQVGGPVTAFGSAGLVSDEQIGAVVTAAG